MDAETLQQALGDIHFPIDKNGLIKHMEEKGMNDVLPFLKKLPGQTFESVEDVLRKLPLGSLTGDPPEL